ncbi:MAG TPA: N-acetylgalactosamine-6-sulfatase, partial [Verrucomicrobiales bacterium]|nr:N-acetylgalactosamine-6-sulfatase [Verrucomicrobiales bacterium]
DLGCFGQKLIQTPRLDQMAAEGMKFTQFYAGSTVCAPSRSVLMTGKHTGRCSVRGNAGGSKQALLPGETTVAELLKGAGYSTALIGKWGIGDFEPGGEHALPTREGFDYFFGYANQHHAHNYYPDVLFRNETRVPLRNVVEPSANASSFKTFTSGAASRRIDYSHDLFADEALQWVKDQKAGPFFLYLALTIPHANNEGTRMTGDGAEVPDHGIYADKDWPKQDKGQAAMITRMDKDVGRLLDLLKELGIAENTLVIFSSDNGPHNEAGHNPKRFNPSGPLTGMKRTLTEGGIRVPTIMWWPGTVKAGVTSDHVGYFGDLMATAADLAGIGAPADLDSISFAPTLTGKGTQKQHDYLYWEFYEQGSRQAVRFGDWKAIREPMFTGKMKLYNLADDLAERHDLAAAKPELVKKAVKLMDEAHVPDERWQVRK